MSYLLKDLLNEHCNYILISLSLSDLIKRQFNKYRHMSRGKFLGSISDVNYREKIKISIIVKEGINFWEEDIKIFTVIMILIIF